jgi:hypothetical protein
MSAALVPRVRILVVCDEAVASEIEDGVFTLEGVRQGFHASSFPCIRDLAVYLLLSYPRSGRFDGQIELKHDLEDKTIRSAQFTAAFAAGENLLALAVDLDNCVFPEPGYTPSPSRSGERVTS